MRPVSPCTTQYLKRSVKRYSVWIVAEVDAMHSKRLLACSNYLGGACGYQIPPIHLAYQRKNCIAISVPQEALALRTEPICSRNKCREHQSVRGVR